MGNTIDTFKQKLSSSFKFVNEEKKENKIYYHFSVITDSKIQNASAGFAGGLTITSESGKITGESLLIQPGADEDIGKKLGAILCLNLAYEALGKPVPQNKQDQQTEFNAFQRAVDDAMSGQPGHINYPGVTNQLIFSRTDQGNLLFVINSGSPSVPAKH